MLDYLQGQFHEPVNFDTYGAVTATAVMATSWPFKIVFLLLKNALLAKPTVIIIIQILKYNKSFW